MRPADETGAVPVNEKFRGGMMKQKLKKAAAQNRRDFIKFLILGIVILAMIGVTLWLMPWIISLKDEAGRVAFEEYIYSKGAYGILILLGVQILQVIIAVIPGEPIEVISGLLYGTFWGFMICEIGVLVGTVIIYYMVKWLGVSFIRAVVDEEKLERFRFLREEKRLETATFLLFFIPGTPKDLLTYFMPLTKIKPLTLFSIVCTARIPSIISSTFAGASIGQGKWIQTVIIFVVIGAIGLLGIWLNGHYLHARNEHRRQQKHKENSDE